MNEPQSVLLVDTSAVSRGRLRDELAPKYAVKVAQTLEIARARVAATPLLGAVVGLGEAHDGELEFLRWMSRQSIPLFVVLRNAGQERRLTGLGIHNFCVAPQTKDDGEHSAHAQRIGRWLEGLSRRSRVSMLAPAAMQTTQHPAPSRAPSTAPHAVGGDTYPAELVICIGVSTGGPDALEVLLSKMPADAPPIVIVQHMPVGFTQALAKRLDAASKLTVTEARGGETLVPGHAWIAPGDRHLVLRRVGFNLLTDVIDGPPVDRHRPSVNVLFESAARVLGSSAMGVIMTGMGDDGARGLLAMRQEGAITVGQDAASSTVFGMPQRAAALGAVEHQVALTDMTARILQLAAARRRR